MYKKASVVAVLSVMFLLIGSGMAIKRAWAHGSMEDPVARVYECYKEGPESPTSAACQAAVAVSGPQPFYDWNGVNLLANDQHRQLIPDGKLCSGNHTGFEGLDLPRTDWVAKTISPDQNGNYTFVYLATAPHQTKYFDFYITNDNYDPSKPLRWSDLEATPFCHITGVTLNNGRYYMTCPLPNKPGKRVIYNIWQRIDSAEAFYACIDVVITNNGGAIATATPTSTPIPGTVTATPGSATPQPSVTRTPGSPTLTPTRVTATTTPQPGATRTPGSPTPTLIPTRPGNDAPLGTNRVYLPMITDMTTE